MESAPLQLFNQTEEENSSPDTTSIKKNKPLEVGDNPQKTLEKALSSLFPSPSEENKIIRARQILGDTVKGVTDEQLNVFINELQYLLDSWFDVFERKVFNGQTLKEILKGGQNGKV